MAAAQATSGLAQRVQVDMAQLITELQRQTSQLDAVTSVWWMPPAFWEATFLADPALSQEEMEQILAVLRPYTLLAVVDGTIGPLGGVSYVPRDQLEDQVVIMDRDGVTHKPQPAAEISADVSNLIAMFRPMLTNMIGPMGANLHVFAFRSDDARARRIADPLSEGRCDVPVGEEEFTWRLRSDPCFHPNTAPWTGRS